MKLGVTGNTTWYRKIPLSKLFGSQRSIWNSVITLGPLPAFINNKQENWWVIQWIKTLHHKQTPKGVFGHEIFLFFPRVELLKTYLAIKFRKIRNSTWSWIPELFEWCFHFFHPKLLSKIKTQLHFVKRYFFYANTHNFHGQTPPKFILLKMKTIHVINH